MDIWEESYLKSSGINKHVETKTKNTLRTPCPLSKKNMIILQIRLPLVR